MKSIRLFLFSLGLVAFAATANAVPYAPQIDFRDSGNWSGANYQTSYAGSASGIDLTVSAAPNPATLYWDQNDGFGVRLSYERDEIEAEEILQVVFNTNVSLSSIYVSDLFVENGYSEMGSYRINGGSWMGFDAASLPGSGSNGEHVILFGSPIALVSSVDFRAPGRIGNEDHEFSVMGFDATKSVLVPTTTNPVPEPGAAALFALGLLVVRARRR